MSVLIETPSTGALSTDSDAHIPIREVSRVTGVNSVTLRAWERRYGLLKPLRTPKGHRLYRRADIERIQTIQSWLARGVSVGKLRDLLGQAAWAGQGETPGQAADWRELIDQWLGDLRQLRRAKLKGRLRDQSALYPLEALTDGLFMPLLYQHLIDGAYDISAQRVALQQVLREHAHGLLLRQRQERDESSRLLFIDLQSGRAGPLAAMLAGTLTLHGYSVDFSERLTRDECIYTLAQRPCRGLLLYGDQHEADSPHYVAHLAEHLSVPVMFAGQLTGLYRSQLPESCQLLGQTHREVVAALRTQWPLPNVPVTTKEITKP
ncbi:MerR family transcriptional regulator [Marinimicrobium alkaliphilum]|uniref:MerR family transcriptional regulator n=1 Tax=Marinimicrobium alkaliphilum TaxID=2202654 RepID=UPI000DB9C8ED|nr:MerR family transcriptional regulator [Marinimicrobium alkaliphilum]